MPPHAPTPARSSLRGKRPNQGNTEKRNVTFEADSTIRRASGAIGSALARTFGPVEVEDAPLETGDDDDDMPYTTTDEERDEFRYEPYEYETSPEPDAERTYEYWYGGRDIARETARQEGEYGEETIVHRTFTPVKSSTKPAINQRFADPTDPVMMLRRNINANIKTSQKKVLDNATAKRDRTPGTEKATSNSKGKMNISNRGSPLLNNTPDIQLRSQMGAQDTPQSGPGIAQCSLDSLKKARRNLTKDYTNPIRVQPRARRPPGPKPLTRLEKNTLTSITTLFLLWAFVTLISKSGATTAIFSNITNKLSLTPEQIVPGIATAIISIPQLLVCSIVTCELNTNKRLRSVAIIATNTNLDVTALKHFTELVTDFGRPLALNSAARDLATEASDKSAKWRDRNTIKTLADLSVSYQAAHEELRQMVGQSQNVIQWTTKIFTEFGGFLTDQIPRELRDGIDLPTGWTIGVPATRKEYPSKMLEKYHKELREGTSKVYYQLLMSVEKVEYTIKEVVGKTQEINDAGTSKMTNILNAVKPLLNSIGELRESIAFTVSHYATDSTFGGEPVGEDFIFSILKWRLESLWVSLSTLPGSVVEFKTRSWVKSEGPQ